MPMICAAVRPGNPYSTVYHSLIRPSTVRETAILEVGQNTWRSRRRLTDAFQLAGGGRDYQRCQDSQWLTGKPEKTSETGDPLTRDSPPAQATWAYP
ncbi:hypothetical protein BN1723_008193 [Verticillium longisporum]|uniref:Uncharacterized protein n=1 Tax=Verticillium longisporum TaxID=100787 RepID=A0A0G4NQS3_VERLO|nr:hypothetical protein BN1723_008193 [Verticillium longisporum]